jgi:cytoskeleton protein RodZ
MRRELDITDAETYTKIRAKYLRALENDEFGTLPDSTLAKTFLRTYAEYLGLDAQLLIEEYRALHEPRGQGEMPALRPRSAREPRRRAGPPIGPGGAFAIGIVLLLVLFAVLGLTGGDEGGDEAGTPAEQADGGTEGHDRGRVQDARERRERRRRAARRVLRVRVVPTGPTYVCIDDGRGRVTFEGTIATARTFRGRRGGRLRINLGRAAVQLSVNGRRVPIEDSPSGAGFSFSRSGRATPLPPEQRPCA